MDLELIKNRKIQSQLRYLQLELEETKIIYEDCLLKFNSDFRNYMMDTQPDLSAPQTSKDTNLEIKTDVEDDTLKQVYRKVAGKTHPDKGGDTDKFKKANEANRNKDLGALMEMADELGVEVPMDSDMRSELSKHIKAVSDTITNLKTTMAWTWCHVDNHNKDTLKQYILQQLNVS
tara:strand:- start:315 stop:842 length:528 start_codon:yes stop_codon:yes gene_type:complete